MLSQARALRYGDEVRLFLEGRSPVKVAAACAVLLVALGAWVFSLYSPRSPLPPGPWVLDAVQSRFTALRPKLEEILAAEQENHRRVFVSDSLRTAGDSAKAEEVDQRYRDRSMQIHTLMRPPLQGLDIVLSDSLVYLSVWARRGYGFSAPWRFVGFVYASRPPDDRRAWPAPELGRVDRRFLGFPFEGRYRHVEGRWYLFSILPWQGG